MIEYGCVPIVVAGSFSPSPLVGEGGRDAKHRGRVRGLSPRIETPHPARFARHLLPQGEKRRRECADEQCSTAIGSPYVSTPMMSLSFMIRSSSPSSLTSVPDHLPNSTRSPTLRSIGISLPASSRPPGPTAVISPCDGFSLALSGMMMPPLVFSSASMRLTTTRSCSGRNLVLAMTSPLEVPWKAWFQVCATKMADNFGYSTPP